jgi:hypothetical protein
MHCNDVTYINIVAGKKNQQGTANLEGISDVWRAVMNPFIPDLRRRRLLPWWVVGPSASEEEISSIEGMVYFLPFVYK